MYGVTALGEQSRNKAREPFLGSAPLHLCQHFLGLWEPQGYVHGLVQIDSRGELGASLLLLTGRGIQLAQAAVAVRLERETHAHRRHDVPTTMTMDGSDANAAAIKSSHAENGTASMIRQEQYLKHVPRIKKSPCVSAARDEGLTATASCYALAASFPPASRCSSAQATLHAHVRRSPPNGETWRALGYSTSVT